MSKSLAYLVVVASFVVGAGTARGAQEHEVVGNGKAVSIVCAAGDSVKVAGNANTVGVTGTCEVVSALGNANQIEVAQTAEIRALGNKNRVVWHKGAGDKAPKITNLGKDNVITKAAQK